MLIFWVLFGGFVLCIHDLAFVWGICFVCLWFSFVFGGFDWCNSVLALFFLGSVLCLCLCCFCFVCVLY